jgi:hypothetical protein
LVWFPWKSNKSTLIWIVLKITPVIYNITDITQPSTLSKTKTRIIMQLIQAGCNRNQIAPFKWAGVKSTVEHWLIQFPKIDKFCGIDNLIQRSDWKNIELYIKINKCEFKKLSFTSEMEFSRSVSGWGIRSYASSKTTDTLSTFKYISLLCLILTSLHTQM